MKWFLVALMTMLHGPGEERDIFIFTTPSFDTSEECIRYVQTETFLIFSKLKQEFPNDPLANLVCVKEDKLKEFFKKSNEHKTGVTA
jgi:hypothetical protein